MTVIAVDCGGTKVRVARGGVGGSLEGIVESATPGHLAALPEIISRLAGDPGGATAVGVGVAGLVDAGPGVLRWMPHRPGRDLPLGAELSRRLGVPAVVDNDANLTGLAEARLGAGAGMRMVLTVTVGTGIGGGLVVDGRIERGRGHLGEVGHMNVDPTGPACACGRRGCWEAMASGTALDRAARLVAASDPRGALASGDVDGVALVVAAAAGDAACGAAVEAVATAFGRGLASLVAILDPDVIVVGGGVGAIGEPILGPARRAMMEATSGGAHRAETPVVSARFGTDAGLVGAALAAGGDW
ncbi:MAG: ROK family protein [Acidimicrobiia bacterium]|nr:ROK family protein [Acidimicrobiia bacterium]